MEIFIMDFINPYLESRTELQMLIAVISQVNKRDYLNREASYDEQVAHAVLEYLKVLLNYNQ